MKEKIYIIYIYRGKDIEKTALLNVKSARVAYAYRFVAVGFPRQEMNTR